MSEWATDSAVRIGECTRLAYSIADARVVSDLEDLPVELTSWGTTPEHPEAAWRDTRAWLNENVHPAQVIDMCRQALYYADLRRLIARHPQHTHLVRILNRRR